MLCSSVHCMHLVGRQLRDFGACRAPQRLLLQPLMPDDSLWKLVHLSSS